MNFHRQHVRKEFGRLTDLDTDSDETDGENEEDTEEDERVTEEESVDTEEDEMVSEEVPKFGVSHGLAALSGLSYLFKRQLKGKQR